MSDNPSSSKSHSYPLRPLLPAKSEDDPAQVGESSSASVQPRQGKRRSIAAACIACQRRKSKCSGERPECAACATRGFECRYETSSTETHAQALKRKYSDLRHNKTAFEEIYNILQTRSEGEVNDILQRIRRGADADTVLRHIMNGDLLLQLSLTPETRRRYEFPFLSEMPASLRLPGNPYLESLIYEGTFDAASLVRQPAVAPEKGANKFLSLYLKPYHATDLVDTQLSEADITKWTSISSDNELLQRLLRAYFLYAYPWYTAFQKEYFLKDLASGRRGFCSALLVNAILAAACHCCPKLPLRSEFWNPQSLGYQFFAEAKRLWELETGKGKLTTIQAAIVMVTVYNENAVDKIGSSYFRRAIEMAQDQHLFSSSAETRNSKQRGARIFTAWALFSFQLLESYYFSTPPLINSPPEDHLPDPATESAWYGEVWVRCNQDQILMPTHFGHSFKAMANLRVIINEMGLMLFGQSEHRGKLTLTLARRFHARLVSWFDSLPGPLKSENIVLPCQLKLHMEYHNTIVSLFEPFVGSDRRTKELPPLAYPVNEWQPQQIVLYGRTQLETILRLYYLRHGFELQDSFMTHFMVFVGFAALHDLTMTETPATLDAIRSTLILCAKGLYEQGQNYYLAEVVLRVLQNGMRLEDLNFLRRYVPLKEVSEGQDPKAAKVRSNWPIPRTKINQDPETSVLESLIGSSEETSASSESRSSLDILPESS